MHHILENQTLELHVIDFISLGTASHRALYNKAGKRNEGDCIRENHELVEHVLELPNDVVLQNSAQEGEECSNQGEDENRDLIVAFAEQVLNVEFCKQVPRENRRERKEQQADANEDGTTALRHECAKCKLSHVGLGDTDGASKLGGIFHIISRENRIAISINEVTTSIDGVTLDNGVTLGSHKFCNRFVLASILVSSGQRTIANVKNADDNEGGHGNNDDSVDENANHCDNALIMRILDVGERMSMRGGTHTGFVAEQTALCALRDCSPNAKECTTKASSWIKCALENEADSRRKVASIHNEHDESTANVKHRHDRHELFGDGGKTMQVANEDEAGEHCDKETDNPCRGTECMVHRLSNGVRLDHGSDKAKSDNGSDGKKAGEEPTAGTLESCGDVVSRAAVGQTVFIDDLRLLSERRFSIVCGHTKKSDDPHPEDGTRTTNEDSATCADDVTRANLCSYGSCNCLKRAHGAALVSTGQRKLGEHLLPALAEAAELYKTRANREE